MTHDVRHNAIEDLDGITNPCNLEYRIPDENVLISSPSDFIPVKNNDCTHDLSNLKKPRKLKVHKNIN
jgi:hypothetical protein